MSGNWKRLQINGPLNSWTGTAIIVKLTKFPAAAAAERIVDVASSLAHKVLRRNLFHIMSKLWLARWWSYSWISCAGGSKKRSWKVAHFANSAACEYIFKFRTLDTDEENSAAHIGWICGVARRRGRDETAEEIKTTYNWLSKAAATSHYKTPLNGNVSFYYMAGWRWILYGLYSIRTFLKIVNALNLKRLAWRSAFPYYCLVSSSSRR